MTIEKLPNWLSNLDYEDIEFIKKFILTSGSLKEIAKLYEVSYPTVRLRLDKLIQNIEINDKKLNEPFISFIKELSLDEKIDLDTAKLIINEYKKEKEEEK
ncbi:DUF2089 family protein [Clostridium sporogenes]|uniref:DUF2089 domain-containing protein n=1 Tax=Clostridium sporogenes TaxID=1509 RepID=A0A7X5P871_CLOSG|nr:DUF2089 family protein [Clostridium sporogenes]AJD32703.1 hypothetical protein T258_3270 [Clostridium botulinum Prevot_594]AVP61405.1 DUF2089 domain-containing protein [Clostridium botulinum]AKC61426.1 hypothetical protein DUF2089 [Clostridium sporogenes]AKJ88757.1 hypothetical protein CLSPOx_03535 [Clostridium sporogenes]EHN15286.1 hypothetical protein IYC_10469 [Clostridium sporogenes PA 3679]